MVKKIRKAFSDYNPYIQGHREMFKCSVLVPLVEKDGDTHVLFEVRSKHLSVQPYEISFPGGGYEDVDESFEDTAIRETCEELGLQEADVEIFSPMDVFITPFDMIIHPFVGTVDYENININKDEVDHVFLVPLDYLLDTEPQMYNADLDVSVPDDFPYHLIPQGKDYKFRKARYVLYFYRYGEYIIWGITAKILKDFLDQLKG
ncbi:NUDIX-family protein [Peptoclostridium acidaminophilum DSM 3953]|uniref:NUDIX-family protein n=1 Tax=Peptoclostridium acidaminophilum DSM 3953 TaxID=1286171 RepID=W8TJB3_PEPAC|nr:CoA pyrophosphatase [Peptoclostridium acidaminophilum]AHM56297.1 NUDIX-family protein [Peptoclostridium acidaminophilum DSM 3953]